jgi:phage shock protein C
MTKKLYRSRSDRMIAGVCGGLGEYFGIDPTIVRVIFGVFVLVDGIGLLAYIALWLIVPKEGAAEAASVGETVREGVTEIVDRAQEVGKELRHTAKGDPARVGIVIGAIMIVVGAIFLMRNLGFPWLRWMRLEVLWPILVIAVGLALLLRRVKGD